MESSSSSGADTAAEKPVMVVGVDESSHSFYALEWTLDRFFAPFAPNHPYHLVIVHARPSATSVLGIAGNGNPQSPLNVYSSEDSAEELNRSTHGLVPRFFFFQPDPTPEPIHSNRIHRLGMDSRQLLSWIFDYEQAPTPQWPWIMNVITPQQHMNTRDMDV